LVTISAPQPKPQGSRVRALQTVFHADRNTVPTLRWPLRRAVPSAALRPPEARPLAESIASSAAMRNRCGMKRWSDAE
jgi:hypothetical protein